MCFGFQLETDESILILKARGALEKYGHELVIGNVLSTRKRKVSSLFFVNHILIEIQVVFVELSKAECVELTDAELEAGVEIESRIVSELSKRHDQFIETGAHK